MRDFLHTYFKTIGNHDGEGYWEQPPNLFQVVVGVAFAPVVVVVWLVVKLLSVKIRF